MTDMEILTVKEVALYLGLKPITIYKLANQGKIPAFKVASYWRFTRGLIEKWAEKERKSVELPAGPGRTKATPSPCTTP